MQLVSYLVDKATSYERVSLFSPTRTTEMYGESWVVGDLISVSKVTTLTEDLYCFGKKILLQNAPCDRKKELDDTGFFGQCALQLSLLFLGAQQTVSGIYKIRRGKTFSGLAHLGVGALAGALLVRDVWAASLPGN